MENNTWILKNRPVGMPKLEDFELVVEDIEQLKFGELRLKSTYISVDPYLRGKMSGTKSPRFEIAQAISSKIIAEVTESLHPEFSKGDFVSHYLDWREYNRSDGTGLVKINGHTAPLSAYLGVLGITGLSAYFALLDLAKAKAGETLVISGAAGAVGSIAGQIGKMLGCKVIGIVGTDDKTALIKSYFGFDAAINYRSENVSARLSELAPEGVDIYLDNVGGAISNDVLGNVNPYGRLIACGSIANYNDTEQSMSPSILPLVVYKFLTIQGFLIADLHPGFQKAYNI